MSYSPPLSTELALRAFEADCAFSAALAAFQAECHGVSGLMPLLAKANQHGFSWIIKPKKGADDFQWQVSLRHVGGAEEAAYGNDVEFLLLHLLGYPVLSATQAPEAELMQHLHQAQESQLQPDDQAVDEVGADAEPEDSPQPLESDSTQPLTKQQKESAIEMVRVLNTEQRKAFTISFRSAFHVPREVKTIVPLITELQHLHFIDRFTVEAAGGIAP
jgi:hypothetical protein